MSSPVLEQEACMKYRRVLGLMLTLVLLSACSNTFLYNQLDWLIPWYVDDYVDLTRPQKKSLKQQLLPLLEWHRTEELEHYLGLLDRLEQDLTQPVDSAVLQVWVDEVELAGERMEQRMLPLAFDLGEQLSDAQMEEFLEKLWERQGEMEEEYLDRDEQTYVEESEENFEESLQEFLGKLSPEQNFLVAEAAVSLTRFDDAWLEERKQWLQFLQGVLGERPDDWQQQITDAMANRQQMQSPRYRQAYLQNQQVILRTIAAVLNIRTEKQSDHLQYQINDLRRSLQKLIAQAD
jgi:hypothetical protein